MLGEFGVEIVESNTRLGNNISFLNIDLCKEYIKSDDKVRARKHYASRVEGIK